MNGDKEGNLYLQLFLVFAPLSLLSIGGGQSILADIQRQTVDVYHWVTQAQFVEYFALARAAPGPGSLFSTLIGYHVGGWLGAVVAALGLFGPSSVLAYVVARAWKRHAEKPWFQQAQRALAPLASGLILAGVLTVLRSASGGLSIYLIGGVATALFMRFEKINPLPLLFAAGVIEALVHHWG